MRVRSIGSHVRDDALAAGLLPWKAIDDLLTGTIGPRAGLEDATVGALGVTEGTTSVAIAPDEAGVPLQAAGARTRVALSNQTPRKRLPSWHGLPDSVVDEGESRVGEIRTDQAVGC